MKTRCLRYLQIHEEEEVKMPKEAEINWDWLETKDGLMFLKKLNKRVKYLDKYAYRITCLDIGCPFDFKCSKNCEKAFIDSKGCPYPCYTFKASFSLAIILSDYYDMINEKI